MKRRGAGRSSNIYFLGGFRRPELRLHSQMEFFSYGMNIPRGAEGNKRGAGAVVLFNHHIFMYTFELPVLYQSSKLFFPSFAIHYSLLIHYSFIYSYHVLAQYNSKSKNKSINLMK